MPIPFQLAQVATQLTYNNAGGVIIGIGTTTAISGALQLSGPLYDRNNNVGSATSVLISTGIGVSWSNVNNLTAGSASAINASNISLNANYYPVFIGGAGSIQTAGVATSPNPFSFNPGSGELQLGGPATLNTQPFFRSTPTISTNFTITSNYNTMSIGPVTINNGITVTVNSGAQWTVV
jgi:hypothetical protein